ncbi:hypothetical protein N658DRAFT_243404 [Parathielavia hyrcaniae]|uniref:Uncharacterized protein n=1 Tax=Parathielavia hyrcaniae TaxID=113614 RepID=A0AAN6Q8F5_9PEZI|nr:hypothetical protein N658DRAFT_243404 [Parathielavia hyrcaniae]
MAFALHIPPCTVFCTPAHPLHPPPLEKPLRIQIEGPVVAIRMLLPGISWHTDPLSLVIPQRAGPELAKLAYRVIYGRHVRPEFANDQVVRDEYLGWVTDVIPFRHIDYYGVTFDHLVPANDPDPDVLQINILELETDSGPFANGWAYANWYLRFAVDLADYTGKKVLAVPRCCQKRRGTQDRARVNSSLAMRDTGIVGVDAKS